MAQLFYEGRNLQDDVEEFIETLLNQGYDRKEIVDRITQLFPGFDIALASEAYEEYEKDNDPANEEATSGDIERFIDDLEADGFPHDEAVEKAMKRYKLTAQEIESMTESNKRKPRTTERAAALSYLDKLESAVNQFQEAYPEMGALSDDVDDEDMVDLDDETPALNDTEDDFDMESAARRLNDLVQDEEWDEEDAAIYIIETEAAHLFDTEEEETALIGELLDTAYEVNLTEGE